MKNGLPANHGLSAAYLASNLTYRNTSGEIELTDIQYEALLAGVTNGTSVLAVAPTSSGKTDVGLYAAASWLEKGIADGARVVFLTSHRALARRKFKEIRGYFASLLMLAPDEVVLATGDDVVDGNGDPASDALSAPVIVATYEKYLNIVSGSGLETGRRKICFVCDEIQLIGDSNRGQTVEILLTLLRNRVGQIVALSAVLDLKYAELLSSWLGTLLIRTTRREVPLIYELRTLRGTFTTSTDAESPAQNGPIKTAGTIETLKELLKNPLDHEPIAVFCMSKKQVFELAETWAAEAARMVAKVDDDLPLFREPTSSAEELGKYLPHRFAYHTADLNEDERIAVETKLDDSNLRVVFATTTLASGLNYSFKTVIIHKWRRWDTTDRVWIPIPQGEFHNMAGRAGRLSMVDKPGRIIYFAEDAQEMRAATRYLEWWRLETPPPRITVTAFPQLSLQLLASGVANSDLSLFDFLQSTFSADRELEINARQPELWKAGIDSALKNLKAWRFVS
ncbi:DEAD/DEAH box helicase [Methylobacterium sp. J-059]|uniref:DEAD/DEAH box helicase n=1 Tax=Methylobacterium sp. J-059 TaxID=2836643 RepID=UPI001FBBDB11|nr:DEAD/DEAH box helicase [Methylobacterium sp. J-059]MCJ2041953.1 DEAD/DEAH box helicase [Methylobacterium sp. J-059]